MHLVNTSCMLYLSPKGTPPSYLNPNGIPPTTDADRSCTAPAVFNESNALSRRLHKIELDIKALKKAADSACLLNEEERETFSSRAESAAANNLRQTAARCNAALTAAACFWCSADLGL